MTTPNKTAIVERATELWRQDRMRNGQPYDITPEEEELREEGFLSVATTELMRSDSRDYRDFIEKEYSEVVLGKPQQPIATLSENEPIPFDVAEAMRTGVSVLGGRQSGKTTLANCLTEKLVEHGIIVYIIDPSTAWMSRRKDFHVLNVPIPDKTKRLLTWNFRNTIFDTSVLNPEQQRDFTELFTGATLKALISLEPQTRPSVFLWLEEAHNSLPLWIFHSKRMPELKRLITVGANLRISFGIVTQFSAEVSKLPLKATQQRYFGQTSEPNDLKYLRNFLGKEASRELRNLRAGEFFYSYRNTLKRFRTANALSQIAL